MWVREGGGVGGRKKGREGGREKGRERGREAGREDSGGRTDSHNTRMTRLVSR